MYCVIWYHLYNLKDVKHTLGGVLLLVKLQAKTSLSLIVYNFNLYHKPFLFERVSRNLIQIQTCLYISIN